jgi:tetrapyrrole methylase family protein/MazG family protein
LSKIVRLEPGPLDEAVIAELRQSKVILFEFDPDVARRLDESNIRFETLLAPDIPDGAVIIVPRSPFDELVRVVDRLLGPGGCPWDQAQTHESLKKYLLEEAYEVIEAIDEQDDAMLREELGDLLLQPVMHGQIKKAAGGFDTNDAARSIVEKLVRRHPHVFGDVNVADADEVLRNWDKIKKTEKGEQFRSILAGVPKCMASLLRAHEVSKRAARVGFEWPDIDAVFDKLREEEAELRDALDEGSHERVESELGDLLFTVVNIARWAKVEPEEALRKMINRFTARFIRMEQLASEDLKTLTPAVWDELWLRAKADVG